MICLLLRHLCKRSSHYQTKIGTERRNFLIAFNRFKTLLSKKGWCERFMHNVELSLRNQISVWPNSPADFTQKLHSLQQHVTQLMKTEIISLDKWEMLTKIPFLWLNRKYYCQCQGDWIIYLCLNKSKIVPAINIMKIVC